MSNAGAAFFWLMLLVGGAIGAPVYNRISGEFIFTWPLCLAVIQQATINSIVRPASRLVSTVHVIAMLVIAGLYFQCCRRLGLANEWLFLFSFLPSWVIVVPLGYLMRKPIGPLRVGFFAWLSYSAFFWAGALITLWRR